MLDTETKRRIDTARDILVGKVPDPKSQVEQITIALIYKFMDDMDAESEEMGGERKFFAGEFARYGWPRLVRSGLGGHEILNLYAEAIARMPENPGIPQLFRSIFNNAYLPYRDPETLRSFLRIIDEFKYDHSERLGDAFEYLLSVLGSQGDAGQFRTPRHIIDFIVAIVDPKKDETVLDPACGTAGFLISSYQHILAANADANGRPALTPDERARLVSNFKGYDISPDMVRLSLVNMYLHGFAAPSIDEYDTLTSEDKWNEYADVILANPPFMSPKGGIRPHNRFSVPARRSEVLFVDYMAEHLTANGRAGIIVPEGVIFQSQRAHTQLRKMLVEDYLVAVVSLPAGVFQPYSGVKTSILILDKTLARRADHIAFFKVENDGYDLGAQRREIAANDLPAVQAELGEYLRRLRGGLALDDFAPATGLVVAKGWIADGGDYNLSGERYRENGHVSHWRMATLKEIATDIKAGFACGKGVLGTAGIPHIRPMNITESGQFTWQGLKCISEEDYSGKEGFMLRAGDVLFNNTNSKELVGKTCLIAAHINGGYSNHMTRVRVDEGQCDSAFLAYVLHAAWRKGEFLDRANKWIGQAGINTKSLSEFQIPLPPLEVQREIVAEIEGYQRVIDGARAVVDNWRPRIAIDPEWPLVHLGEVCRLKRGPFGGSLKKEIFTRAGYAIYEQSHAISENFGAFRYFVDGDKYKEMEGFAVFPEDIIMSCSGTMGRTAIIPDNAPPGIINQALLKLTTTDKILNTFVKIWTDSANFQKSIDDIAFGAAIKNVASVNVIKGLQIPLPTLETQRAIVAETEAERALVEGNRALIERMEGKIQAAIERVWGDLGRITTNG